MADILNTAFYFVLNMSISAAVVIVLLLLIRRIRAIPRTFIYAFWSLAFLRLLLPFSVSSPFSLFNFTGGLIKKVVYMDTFVPALNSPPVYSPSVHLTMANSVGAAQSYAPVTYHTQVVRDFFALSSDIWLIGALVCLSTAAVLYVLTRAELKKAVRVEGNVYVSEMLTSPMLVGIFRPRIIVPAGLDIHSNVGRYVLAHENVHRKRLDNLWRVLAIAVVCMHWFDPFAWILLKCFFSDMELSCDEKVVKLYDVARRKEYASALVSFADSKKFMLSTSFGRSTVKVRVMNVLNYKRLTTVGAIVSVLFLIAIAVLFITNPQK